MALDTGHWLDYSMEPPPPPMPKTDTSMRASLIMPSIYTPPKPFSQPVPPYSKSCQSSYVTSPRI